MTVTFVKSPSFPHERCGICLRKLKENVFSHGSCRFHGHCIEPWLKSNPTCPLCRARVDTRSFLQKIAQLLSWTIFIGVASGLVRTIYRINANAYGDPMAAYFVVSAALVLNVFCIKFLLSMYDVC